MKSPAAVFVLLLTVLSVTSLSVATAIAQDAKPNGGGRGYPPNMPVPGPRCTRLSTTWS